MGVDATGPHAWFAAGAQWLLGEEVDEWIHRRGDKKNGDKWRISELHATSELS